MNKQFLNCLIRLQLILTALASTVGLSAFDQQAYVWQRGWSERLQQSILSNQDVVDGFSLLWCEYTPGTDAPIAMTEVDPHLLGQLDSPITLVIRLNYHPNGVEASFEQGFFAQIDALLDYADQHALSIAALEIDFDAPTSQLERYARQLDQVRKRLRNVPLSITTLPTWMNRPKAFGDLIRKADRYVLQVHSIKRPKRFEDEVSLCDPERALRWARQAAKFGVAYHVALPTYGYRMAYDPTGALVDIAAEDASATKHPDWTYREVRSDPIEISNLVEQFKLQDVEHLHGIIWYRLPIGNERYNWDINTWRAVMTGPVEHSDWDLSTVQVESGLVEIRIENTARVAMQPPEIIEVDLGDATALAWDGQRNYSVQPAPPQRLFWRWPASMSAPHLAPGETWTIGWIRLHEEATTLELKPLK